MAFDLTFQLIEHRGDFSKLDPMQLAMSTLSGALGGAVSARLAAVGAKFLQTLIVNALASGVIDGGLQLARNAVEGNELSKDVVQSFTTSAVGGALGEVGELGAKQLGRIAKQVAGEFMGFVRQVIRGNVDDFVEQGVKQLDNVVDDVVKQVDDIADEVHLCATSFVAGTEVLTPDGLVNIEDIEIGDWVLSDDPETPGEVIAKQVTRTFERTAHDSIFELNIDGEIIATTEEHPFWVVDQGWTSVHELEVGDFFLTDDGDLVDLDGINRRDGSFRVYNFEVQDFHTYFVSENGILVHNMACINPRNAPGIVSGGDDLPVVDRRWFKGTDGNLGIIPKQIGDKLSGRNFKNFDDFRMSFWKEVAADSNLSSKFSKSNQIRMSSGKAPIAPKSQHLGKVRSYSIHHKTPIQHGGGVFDLDNMVIVTPRLHKEILNPKFHYGKI